jgi:hypothetical protein
MTSPFNPGDKVQIKMMALMGMGNGTLKPYTPKRAGEVYIITDRAPDDDGQPAYFGLPADSTTASRMSQLLFHHELVRII